MAAVLVEEQVIAIGQSLALVFGTVTMDSSYPTGGEAIDAPGDRGYIKVACAGGGAGNSLVWDKANQKALAYNGTTQIANTTDLSAVVWDIIAVRPA